VVLVVKAAVDLVAVLLEEGRQQRAQAAVVEVEVVRKMEVLALKKIFGQIGLEMFTAPAAVAEAKVQVHLVRQQAQVTAVEIQVQLPMALLLSRTHRYQLRVNTQKYLM
jgi:hypothetical protein